jgi:hypothetical protein
LGATIPKLGELPIAEPLALTTLFLPVLAFGYKKWLNRYVWIDYVNTEYLEIVFKRKSYAEQFCSLNRSTLRRKFVNFKIR